MTNWMTAAGIAFIAGGLATLIGLRTVLFGGGERRRARRAARADQSSPPQRRGRPEDLVTVPEQLTAVAHAGEDDHSGGLASIGFAQEEPEEDPDPQGDDLYPDADDYYEDEVPQNEGDRELVPTEIDAGVGEDFTGALGVLVEFPQVAPSADRPAADLVMAALPNPEPPSADAAPVNGHQPLPQLAADEPPATVPGIPTVAEPAGAFRVRRIDRSDRRYGHRVDGWVRPHYRDEPTEPPSGDYWTPVPAELSYPEDGPEPSARGYGWPVRVERLPAVPPYEPATGFDLPAVTTEPTELVPVWPPKSGRTPLRSWPPREEPRSSEEQRSYGARQTQRRRPRPRPRPVENDRSNVYVSRHAAEPPR